MKKYKYFHVELLDEKRYRIYMNNGNAMLGEIIYYSAWDRWILDPVGNTSWTTSRLRDVIDFIENEIPKAGRR